MVFAMTEKSKKPSGPTVVGAIEEELSFGSTSTSTASRVKTYQHIISDNLPAALPRVRRLAKERNVDLTQVKGSGPGGCILESDL